jgi:rubrerythrin
MAVLFNAEEVFQIGIQIEKNGEAFYIAAAEISEDPDVKKFFRDLAVWENGHIRLFSDLKEALSAGFEQTDDPDGQKQAYLNALAGGHVFLATRDVKALVTNCRDAGSILKLALTFEKDSVVVYTAMKNMVPEGLGHDKIDKLINEEIQHVVMLQKKLAVL